MKKSFINTINKPLYNRVQHKLIVLVSTLEYINKKHQKYTQSDIFLCFNANLIRNGQATIKLKTMQNYLYKLEKELNVTTNYYKHMGVNCGTEIYYKLNYPKKECYLKINQYFKDKKNFLFKSRLNKYFNDKSTKKGNVDSKECFNNKNNIKEKEKEKSDFQIEKYQIKNYYNKCKFLSKKSLLFLNLDINKETSIEIFKIVKRIEIDLKNNKNLHSNKSSFKEKQDKLKLILNNTKKQLQKKGYDNNQINISFQNLYEKYKKKPHFIIENQKYKDLDNIKRKLEKSIEITKENSSKNCKDIKTNTFNVLIELLKKELNIEVLKPIIKEYLNNKKKIEYNKLCDIYYYELLELIKNQKNSLNQKGLNGKAI
ncbi:plasmid maintenance protein [Borreliella garinii]|uniref:plasmid maintenance protein n=1 Tax=Borreliella garinii TaxID=29519 RepID=UPI001AEF955B